MGFDSIARLFVAGVLFLQLHRLSALGVNELLYFRILRPPDIGYIFSAAPARDFGGDFTSSYDEIFLVPAEPADGCSELRNTHLMEGQVILLQRGGCSFVRKARNVEEAGGRAVLIADDAWDNDSQYLDMITDGTTDTPSIPALFLLGRDGVSLAAPGTRMRRYRISHRAWYLRMGGTESLSQRRCDREVRSPATRHICANRHRWDAQMATFHTNARPIMHSESAVLNGRNEAKHGSLDDRCPSSPSVLLLR
ncbi:hypothetical protein JZ751_016235, partial [Albula glossodonta]